MRTRKTALGMTIASLTAVLCAVAVPGNASAQASSPSSGLTFGQAASGAHTNFLHRATSNTGALASCVTTPRLWAPAHS
jgi:hypothetical protein